MSRRTAQKAAQTTKAATPATLPAAVPTAQSMAERIRLHTARRLGHFKQHPVRLVPTMRPAEVARHAAKDLEAVYAQALDRSPHMREALNNTPAPQHELHAVDLPNGNRWWVVLSALAGQVSCQAMLAHRDVEQRPRLFRFFGTAGPAHHYPVGLAERMVRQLQGTLHERMGQFLLDHVTGPQSDSGQPDEQTRFIVARLGGIPCIGKWHLEEGLVNYFELPA